MKSPLFGYRYEIMCRQGLLAPTSGWRTGKARHRQIRCTGHLAGNRSIKGCGVSEPYFGAAEENARLMAGGGDLAGTGEEEEHERKQDDAEHQGEIVDAGDPRRLGVTF